MSRNGVGRTGHSGPMRTLVIALVLLSSAVHAAEPDDPDVPVEPAPGPITLRLKTAAPKASPWGELLSNVATRIRKTTDGRITVKTFWSQKSEVALVRQCQTGKTDGIAVSLGALASVIPELDATELPFLFDSYAAADRGMARATPIISELLQRAGFVYALRGENGFRHFAAKGLFLATPADFVGKVMRSQPSKVHVAMWKALGAEPKELQVADVPTSLASGVIAGYDNTLLFARLAGWTEAITHVTLSSHVYQGAVVVWCKPWFDALPADLQTVVRKPDPKLEESGLKLVRVFNDKLMPKQYEAQGKLFRTLTSDERAVLEAKLAPVNDAFAASATPDGKRLLAALNGR